MSARNELRLLAFTEEGKENVEAVHKIAREKDARCVWVTVDEVEKVQEHQDDVIYVADPVEGDEAGPVVDHLVSLKFPVIGPQCALTALKYGIRFEANLKYPVYALTMLGTRICFSNVMPDEREELVRLVELMGGKVAGPLDDSVTHLVVGEVGSVKYFTATECGIPVLVKDWIKHLWKIGQSRYICAKDGTWEQFKCPVFLGCSVCVTGFAMPERSRIQNLVTKFGGEYRGAMKLNVTTHLVVNKPEGQKYAMADKFGVKKVNADWVYDSVEKGACQDNMKYPVKVDGYKKSVSQSTPERRSGVARIDSMDISCIDPSIVNETVASTMNDTSRMSMAGSQSFLPPPTSSQVPVSVAQARQALLAFPTDHDYSDILDGINVYLAGFTPNEEEKMKQLLSLAGAIKYNQLTSSVSHVIVGASMQLSNAVKSEISTAAVQNCDLCTVKYTWVLACLKKGELVPEKQHWDKDLLPRPVDHEMETDRPDETAMSNDSTVLEHKDTIKRKPGSTRLARDGSMLGFLNHRDVDDNEMLSQYMNPHMNDETTRNNSPYVGDTMNEGSSFLRRNLALKDSDMTMADVDETTPPQHDDVTVADMSCMPADATQDGLFGGKSFIVLGFDNEEMQHIMSELETNGGIVLSTTSKRIADYAIVPLTGWPVDRTVQDIVTNFWLDLSLSEERLVDVDEHTMCTPLSVPPDTLPLQGCVTCLSKYCSSERIFLSRLIRELGGTDQDSVARRNIGSIKQTTHLIIAEPGGEKYTGCKNWGIDIVTADWVYESARKGKKQNEANFSPDVPQQVKATSKAVEEQVASSSAANAAEIFAKTEALTKGTKKQQNYSSWNTEFPPMPRPPSKVDKIRERLERKKEEERKAREEAMKNKETPLHVRYKRLNLETPSKFMTKGVPLTNVSFDLTEVFELLKTPKEEQMKIRKEIEKNPETPMSEFITRCLDAAVANIPDNLIKNLEKKLEESFEQREDNAGENADTSQEEEKTPLIFENLILSLAKKLHLKYPDLGKIVMQHGGEFRWTYDNSCTHFLFQGRLNDKNKEFCRAKKDGKYVVSPQWVNACVQTNSKIDETLFPHVYDPNKSLQVLTSSPPKTRRQTRNGGSSRSETSSAGSEEETTMRKRKRKASKEPESAAQDSQEAKESLRKKLEHIMSARSVIKETHMNRLSCSRTNTPSPSIAVAQKRTAVGTPLPLKDLDHDKTELSQDVQVSWDDPTGREEMERLMRQNETADESSFKIPENISCLQQPDNTDNDITVDMPPEEAEESQDISQIILNGRKPRFIVSSVSSQEKANIAAIVKDLGGEFSDAGFLDAESTHLLVAKPARSEKFLSALASGKWILHTRYISACQEAGRFLKEDAYEYGNPKNPDTENVVKNPGDLLSQMSLASHRWRKKLDDVRKRTSMQKGAFTGWKVLLHASERQLKGFERLLKCGCAETVSTQLPPTGMPADITHAFIDAEKAKHLDPNVIEDLVARTGIHVCIPSYIGEYLTKDPLPEPQAFYLPQITAIMQRMDQENNGRETKRRKVEGKPF